MKAKLLLLLFLWAVLGVSCNDNDDPLHEYLWTPSLAESTIADGSVTIKWSGHDSYYMEEINTRCMMPLYVDPERFEIYQSDHPADPFVKIADIENTNTPVSFTVDRLTNGQPVYFRVSSLHKNYETIESSTFCFIPNPQPKAEVVFDAGTVEIYQLAISPDVTKIAYIKYINEKQMLYVSDINGVNTEIVTNNGHEPVWSHDSNKIYFKTGLYNAAQIMCYNCETKEISAITEYQNYYYRISVSPDATKMLYELQGNTGISLYVYDIEQGKDSLIMNLQKNGTWTYEDPSWVDNDTYLIKKSKAGTNDETTLSLVSYKDPAEEELIAAYAFCSSFASLSPDRKNVAYISIFNGAPCLFVYNIPARSTRQLTGYEGFKSVHFYPHLTWKDTNTLYYADNQGRVLKVFI